jgi:hypothetical protein
LRTGAIAALLALATPVPAMPAAAPLATGRSGTVKVASDRALEITGLSGELTVRRGKPREIRFQGRDEVALRRDEGRLVLSGTPGVSRPAMLEVEVGPEMAVAVETSDSTLRLTGLGGPVRVVGSGLTVQARALKGDLTAEIDASKLRVFSVEGDVRLDGREIDATLAVIKGQLEAEVQGGKLDVRSARGVWLDAERVTVSLAGVRGPLRGRASDGTIALDRCLEGGELELARAPATISRVEGDLTISTDRDVEFRSCTASLHVDSYGGSVRGTGNDGLLEIRTTGAEVKLSGLSGPVRIQGSDLRVAIENVAGALYLEVTSSTVGIARAVGDVDIDIERGDVDVLNQTGRVSVLSKGGSVRVREARGSVEVGADGDRVEVAWVALAPEIEGYVTNASGGATVRLPERAAFRLEARSGAGRVRSEIGGVEVSADGASAVGPLAAGGQPLIQVEAAGDVEILGPEPKSEGRR